MSLINLQQLPNEAKGELPPADQKLSKSRGTLAWWVITTMLGMLLTLAAAYNSSLQSQISNLQVGYAKQSAKLDSLQNVITDMLKQQINDLRPAKASAVRSEVKTDSLINNIKP